jgi:hypothetical protein
MRITLRRAAASGVLLTVAMTVSGAVASAAQAATSVLGVFGPITGVPTTQAISSGRFSGFTGSGTASSGGASVAIGVIVGLAVLALIAYVGLRADRGARRELRAVEGPGEVGGEVAGSPKGTPAEDEERRRAA